MKYISTICLRLVEIGYLTTRAKNLYIVDSWDMQNGFYLTNKRTGKAVTRETKYIFKFMSPDSIGYDMFKDEIPEYFI